jgi:formylglycine-generating enzyme required for sulfatase activity
MKLSAPCPHCLRQVELTPDRVGRSGPCAQCSREFEPIDIPFGQENRYLLKRYLGAGGMGVVFAARDLSLGRDVALKVPGVMLSFQLEERFKTEVRAFKRLNHKNICNIYDNSKWEGVLYYTMRFLDGGTLTDRIAGGELVSLEQSVDWVLTVARAMDYAHSMGVVHRDLKPANLMFDRDGTIQVTDFGLALLIDDPDGTRITRIGDRLGTPHYMAPEQLRGLPGWHGPASDIYSLGVVLYELLTGKRPYRGQGRRLEDTILAGRPARPSQLRHGIPRELDQICLKAMERLIDDRYESMHRLAGALAAYVGQAGQPPAPAEPLVVESTGPRVLRHGRLGISMARIPAAEFVMGSQEAEDERPQRRVRIPTPFFAQVHPVTQAEYRAVVGALPGSLFVGEDRRPVDSVSWLDAIIFCNLLSARDDFDPYYRIQGERVRLLGGSGYRLLTEAEWEYAARGGGAGRYGVTDNPAELGRVAWFAENSDNQTHEVGLKDPNGFGLHDVLGNVWEWCWDWYARDGYQQRSDGEDDQGGPASGSERVLRGGCWNSDPQSLRCATRIPFTPTELPLYYFGFRLARTITFTTGS